ncbi:MAG: O-antigen ligase family protein [Anaerolineaceae bacterium]|nr:O-antigen ligase family protein [Anaerolineaceae bacterium]
MQKSFEKVTWVLWLALVAVLPITSMPLVAKLFHSSAVAPASLLFLVPLLLLWIPVYVWRKGTFPFQTWIALAFFFSAIISTALSFFLNLPAYKGQGLRGSVFEGLATLVIGLLFYLVFTVLPNSHEKLNATLRAINWGGAVMVGWTILVQVITMLSPDDTPHYLRVVQHLISTTTFFGSRAVGFASEPSWLAHLVNLVYLPYWLAATLTRFSAHKVQFKKITFENVLLLGGVATLFVSFSRAGWAAFMLVLAYLFIRLNVWLVKKLSACWKSPQTKALITALFIFVLIAAYIAFAAGALYVFSKFDPRMASVFSLQTLREQGFTQYANMLQFGERITYWQTGWRIFNQYPLFGVGVGNAGFYFQKLLPDEAWQLTEVRSLVYHSTNLINIKSLWVRLLAETGVVGFAFFVVFLLASLYTARVLIISKNKTKQTIGWMGICMLIAFLIEGFSVDSFALPYYWFTLGLVAAAWRWDNVEKETTQHGSI